MASKSKPIASHGEDLSSTIADIEASAKTPTPAVAAFEPRTPKRERGDPLLNDIARAERVAERAQQQATGKADGRNGVPLSQQTLGDFLAPAKQIGFDLARLSKLDPYELLKARAAHRRFRESGGDRQHLVGFMKELGDGSAT